MKKTTASALLTLLFFCLNAQNTNILGEWTMRNMFKTKPEIIELGATSSTIIFFENGKASSSMYSTKTEGDWKIKDSLLTIAGKTYQMKMLTDSALIIESTAKDEHILMLYSKGKSLKAQNDFNLFFAKTYSLNLNWGELYKVVETMPVMQDCGEISDYQARRDCHNEKIEAFVKENARSAIGSNPKLKGKGYIRFIVEPDGTITSAEIVNSFGQGCGEEALRLVKMMPKWSPGKQRGKPVRVMFLQTIELK